MPACRRRRLPTDPLIASLVKSSDRAAPLDFLRTGPLVSFLGYARKLRSRLDSVITLAVVCLNARRVIVIIAHAKFLVDSKETKTLRSVLNGSCFNFRLRRTPFPLNRTVKLLGHIAGLAADQRKVGLFIDPWQIHPHAQLPRPNLGRGVIFVAAHNHE